MNGSFSSLSRSFIAKRCNISRTPHDDHFLNYHGIAQYLRGLDCGGIVAWSESMICAHAIASQLLAAATFKRLVLDATFLSTTLSFDDRADRLVIDFNKARFLEKILENS